MLKNFLNNLNDTWSQTGPVSLEKDSVVAIWLGSFERGELSKGLENFLRMGDAGEDLGLGEKGTVRAAKSSSLGDVA